MAFMSYCRFENTTPEVEACAEDLRNGKVLNGYEESYRSRLYEACKEYIEAYEHYEPIPEDDEDEDDDLSQDLVCFEVETKYKSGRKKTEVLTFKDEETMWAYYDKHHDKDLIEHSLIADAWPY